MKAVANGRLSMHKIREILRLYHELKREKSVTLQLLWYEYTQANPDGIQYSQFCAHYRGRVRKLDSVMRQTHRAGGKMFVDFAGETVPIVDPVSGKIEYAYVYVAVLGASNYTYAETTMTQDLESWVDLTCNALEFFGGRRRYGYRTTSKLGCRRLAATNQT